MLFNYLGVQLLELARVDLHQFVDAALVLELHNNTRDKYFKFEHAYMYI